LNQAFFPAFPSLNHVIFILGFAEILQQLSNIRNSLIQRNDGMKKVILTPAKICGHCGYKVDDTYNSCPRRWRREFDEAK
jgi:predicted Zn-ribbon and HTH transcriptional regulator